MGGISYVWDVLTHLKLIRSDQISTIRVLTNHFQMTCIFGFPSFLTLLTLVLGIVALCVQKKNLNYDKVQQKQQQSSFP